MNFEFITDVKGLTELDVLVQIYNLLLLAFYFALAIIGWKCVRRNLRKGDVSKWKI